MKQSFILIHKHH